MIFSKANLMVGDVASRSELDRVLNCIRLNRDGSTVASNGKVIMAVGPLEEGRVHFPDVGPLTTPPPEGVSVPLDLLDKVVKNLPKTFQNVAMTQSRDPKKIQLTVTDTRQEQHIAGYPKIEPFPAWQAMLRKVRGEGGTRVCVNRKTLIDTLQALEAACPDKGGENPVFIEINPESTGLLLRCVNRETQQRAIAGLTAYKTRDQWLPSDKWEQSVFQVQTAVKKKL